MRINVDIPKQLLKQADERAKALGISRERFIVRALQREVHERTDWPPEFFHRLREINRDTAATIEELITVVRKKRSSKPPPPL